MTDADAAVPGDGARPAASGRQIAKGAAWLMLFKLLDRSIGLVSTLILARLLTPADFGLVAMAMAVVALTQLMGAFGFDTALIQRQDCRREHYDTAWTFSVLFGVAIATLLLVLAVPAAGFYRDDRLTMVLVVLAVGALAGGFENVGTVAFRKELDFRSEFRFLLLKRAAAFVVTIGLAVGFRSYWALVAGTVTSQIVAVAISYRLHPYRPRLTLAARADLLHFSKWIFISNGVDFLHRRSTDFILGRTVGSYGLGVYNVASEIASMPSTELIAPLNRAVYPAYARLASDLQALRARFVEVFGGICLIGLPIAFGLFCVADPAVRVVLGPQWLDAIPLIRIFTVCGLVSALQSNLYLVIVALGKPKASTLLSASVLAFSLPTVIVASLQYGLRGAAYAQLASALVALAGIVTVFTRISGVRVATLARAAWRPLVGSVLMAAALLAVDGWVLEGPPDVSVLPRLLLLLLIGAAIYPLAMAGLWAMCGRPVGAERTVVTLLRRQLVGWSRPFSQQA